MKVDRDGQGHAVLCLHGIGGGAHWFRGLALRLREHCQVMALDLPGTGANRGLASPFTIEACVDALAAYIRQHADKPISILGHSMGTILALKLYDRIPEHLRSLILVGGVPSVIPMIRTRLSERREKLLQVGKAGLGWSVAEGVFSVQSIQAHPEMVSLFARHWEDQPLDEYVESIEGLLGASADDLVAKVKAPCLVLAGAEDRYAPPEKVRSFASALGGPTRHTELPGCGHMTFLENPEAFSLAVKGFLAELNPPH